MSNLIQILAAANDVTCAGGTITVDRSLPDAISTIINILKIAIPILVILFGLIDLGKAVMSAKEDDIKKNQGLLIKRIIVAVFVFFVVAIVQFVVGIVAGGDKTNILSCIDLFVNGSTKHVE